MTDEKIIGPELLIAILRESETPMTTRQLYLESRKRVPNCASANVVILNLMRLRGTIKGKRTEDKTWIWWVED